MLDKFVDFPFWDMHASNEHCFYCYELLTCEKMGLMALLPSVVDLASTHNIPVIAAGGIVDARGYVAALALGAKGVCMGTRLVFFFLRIRCSIGVYMVPANKLTAWKLYLSIDL